MNLLQIRIELTKLRRFDIWTYRNYCKPSGKGSKKYSDTLLLPKTNLPLKIASKARVEHEAKVATVSESYIYYRL